MAGKDGRMADTCPLCGHGAAMTIDARPEVAVIQNRAFASAAAARGCAVAPLVMSGCLDCGFVWNSAFDPQKIDYGPDYENCQLNSAAFAAHVDEVAGHVLAAVPAGEPIDLLEIGCGQGDFMRLVAARARGRLRSATGFDPTWRDGPPPVPGASVHRAYFGQATAHLLDRAPNVVVLRHTIEHVAAPRDLLAGIVAALDARPGTLLFIETPTAAWILEHEAVQDFFYEHCSLFTAETMDFVLRATGFEPVRIDHLFGGQYLFAQARIAAAADRKAFPPAPPLAMWRRYAAGRQRFLDEWAGVLADRAARGPVALWGAGAKGATFALLLDRNASRIACVIDVNPNKQGGFVPVTGHAIVAPADAARRGVGTVIVMNPNYLGEIAAECARVGLGDAELIALNG